MDEKILFLVLRVKKWNELAVVSPMGSKLSISLDSYITDMHGFCPVYDSLEAAEAAFPGAEVVAVSTVQEVEP